MHARSTSSRFSRSTSRLLLFSATLLAAAAVPVTARAQQQVSDADRNTARDLYKEGWSLQQAGKYSEALDKYQRSIAVYSAPTTALRIAQCRAALGQLVEAAEGFRAIRNAQLPAGSPEAFVKAQQEAATELQSVEPRIPKLKINVTPANATGLTVTIDGQPMPTALLGVGRAIDPGTHKVVVIAPGYAQAEQSVEVREKQQPSPEVNITLTAQAGVSYTPSGGGTTGGGTTGGGTTYGGGTYQGGYGQQGGYQGPYGGRPWVPPAKPRGPSTALLLGANAVVSVPFGDGPLPGATNNATSLNDALGVGGGVGGEVGLRFARIVYLGAMLQGSFFNNYYSGASLAVDGVLGFMSNPDGVGFYGELGGGYRAISYGGIAASGGDFLFGLGLQFKWNNFRIIPKADFFVGPFSDPNDPTVSFIHGFFTIGVSGYWELPLSKPQQPAASNPPAAY